MALYTWKRLTVSSISGKNSDLNTRSRLSSATPIEEFNGLLNLLSPRRVHQQLKLPNNVWIKNYHYSYSMYDVGSFLIDRFIFCLLSNSSQALKEDYFIWGTVVVVDWGIVKKIIITSIFNCADILIGLRQHSHKCVEKKLPNSTRFVLAPTSFKSTKWQLAVMEPWCMCVTRFHKKKQSESINKRSFKLSI